MSQFTGDTSVRHILTTHPRAFAVFEAHGMCEDCRIDPPPVPLHHFAGRHNVALEDLIGQLEAAINSDSQRGEG